MIIKLFKWLKFFSLLVFLPISLQAETFYLINPSIQCQAYLEISFKEILSKEENLYIINLPSNDKKLKQITKYNDYEYIYNLQGYHANMIISKTKNNNTGTLIILDDKNSCRSH